MFYAAVVGLLLASASTLNGEVNVSQIHLSLSGDDSLMGLEYVSQENTTSVVQYKTLKDLVSKGQSKTKVTFREHIGYLHRAVLDGLIPSAEYLYRIGDGEDNWSEWYPFKSGPYARDDFRRVGDDSLNTYGEGVGCVFADLGLFNGLSTERIKTEGALGSYDYMVHIGDIAYDLYAEESQVGNDYMDLMMSATQRYGINVAEGNHERGDNFTEYNLRFKSIEDLAGRISGSHSNHYYSYDVGLIHYVVVSTEVYSYPDEASAGPSPYTAEKQLHWLEADLKRVNADGRREKTPWVVLLGHRPWYTQLEGWAQIDDLACRYGVDLYITGHVHNYQRWAPMRVSSVGSGIVDRVHEHRDKLKEQESESESESEHKLSSSVGVGVGGGYIANPIPAAVDTACISEDKHTYHNPLYMPVIVAGSTGCHSPAPRSACAAMYAGSKVALKNSLIDCTAAYGFGHLQAVNSTHLYWELVQSHRAPSVDTSMVEKFFNKIKNKTAKATDTEDVESEAEASAAAKDEADQQDILDAYAGMLETQGVTPEAFMQEVQAAGERWVKSELARDAAVEQEEQEVRGVKESISAHLSGGRIVRDHLWIVQENHGIRDYC